MSVNELKKLEDDQLYSRNAAHQALGISSKSFYKYYVNYLGIKEDERPNAKRYFYRGSTINAASKQLSNDKKVPYYIEDED